MKGRGLDALIAYLAESAVILTFTFYAGTKRNLRIRQIKHGSRR